MQEATEDQILRVLLRLGSLGRTAEASWIAAMRQCALTAEVEMPEDKNRAIELAIRTLEKQKKAQNLVFRADSQLVVKVPVVSSGSLGLDIALGVGGLPRGRVVELIGPESVGKTTLALQAIANAQAQGLMAFYVDAEHSLDLQYAQALGVDPTRLYFCQPDNGSQAMDALLAMIKTGAFGIAVVDSVSALTPEKEAEGQISDQEIGGQARLMSKALRMLVPWVRKTGCCLIFLNQVRYKVGVMFGNPETSSGGNALMHYASVRVKMSRQLSQDVRGSGDERVGNQVTCTVIKNKLALPFRKAVFDILYGKGVDRPGELVLLGLKYDLVSQNGGWYSLDGEKVAHGRDNFRSYLIDHPEAAAALEERIRETAFGSKELLDPLPEEEEADLENLEREFANGRLF